jgi:hypothetical protein
LAFHEFLRSISNVRFEVFTAVTMKNYEEEEREVGSSERHYGWGEQNI